MSTPTEGIVHPSLMSELSARFRQNIQTYTIILALVAIWGLFALQTSGNYLSPQNFSNLFRQMTVTSFLAAGMVLVIVTGNIDLSVGKLAGFVSVVAAYFQARVWGNIFPDQGVLSAILSVSIAIFVGVLFGALQGYIIAYLNVPSFIVSLGGMFVLTGAILLVTEGKTIPANQPEFAVIAQAYLPPIWGWIMAALVVGLLYWSMFNSRRRKQQYGFLLNSFALDMVTTTFFSLLVLVYVFMVNQYRGLQIPVLILALTVVLMSYVASNTRFGRYAYAIGGNREASRLSGINIRRSIFLIFVLMGFLSGVAGVVLASYVGYGTIAAGTGYELDAIASCILGGTSTLGGIGTIFGAMIGSLIMTSLTTGLQMLNTAPALQPILKGTVLVLAVFADMYFKKNK